MSNPTYRCGVAKPDGQDCSYRTWRPRDLKRHREKAHRSRFPTSPTPVTTTEVLPVRLPPISAMADTTLVLDMVPVSESPIPSASRAGTDDSANHYILERMNVWLTHLEEECSLYDEESTPLPSEQREISLFSKVGRQVGFISGDIRCLSPITAVALLALAARVHETFRNIPELGAEAYQIFQHACLRYKSARLHPYSGLYGLRQSVMCFIVSQCTTRLASSCPVGLFLSLAPSARAWNYVMIDVMIDYTYVEARACAVTAAIKMHSSKYLPPKVGRDFNRRTKVMEYHLSLQLIGEEIVALLEEIVTTSSDNPLVSYLLESRNFQGKPQH
jgi:hypothetical protein